MSAPRSRKAFEGALNEVLDEHYHHRHPFNLQMHEGQLNREALGIWIRNRYYYQTRIPIKDGMILGKAPEAEFRREWIQRIQDHDGRLPGEGGLELWLQLAESVGLDRAEVASLEGIVPGVRRACDAYVEFVASHDLLDSVAASLTELRAGKLMHTRIEAFEKHYRFIGEAGLAYFRSRTQQAPRDADWGVNFVLENARERAEQDHCLKALLRKCEILWSLLDAVQCAASVPRMVAHALWRRPTPGSAKSEAAGSMVVLPERAVEIRGSGDQILELCDGTRQGEEVALRIGALHPGESSATGDAYDFIASMVAVGVLELRPSGDAS